MTYPYPWQQTQWQQLQTARQSGRMPHALLFAGVAGLGKHDFAHALAKNLLCENPSSVAPDQLCNCRQCQLFTANTHPDFFVVMPEGDSKTIKVDQIRELIASLNQTAQYGGYQAVIIEPAEALNIAAANALLKTLEEPQGQVVLMLITQQRSLLPATICSRCQQVLFKIPPSSIAKLWLSEKLSAEVDIDLLLKHAEGAPLAAQALMQSDGIKQREQLWQQLCQIKTGELNPIAVAAHYAKQDTIMCLTHMINLLQDMLRSRQTQKIPMPQLFNFLDLVCNRKHLLAHHNGINAQLLLEEIFINWVKLC